MKKLTSYIMTAVMAVSLTACEGFLTKEPVLSQSDQLTLSTYEGLDKVVGGNYVYLFAQGWYGQDWVISAEMRSGNGVKDQVRNSNRCTGSYNWNYTPDNTSSIWAYSYYMIYAANNVIDNLEGKGDPQDLNNLKAEALFQRAIAHWACVVTYGQPYTYKKDDPGVPVVLHADPAAKPKRETVAKVYEQVVADLLEAEEIIDPAYVRQGVKDARACADINVIRAFLSRVYLYMGEWQNAADYATKVIDSGKYTMWTAEEYPTVWGAETGSGEVIFEVYGKRTNGYYGSWEDLSYLTSPEGSGDPMVSQELLGMYAANDVRLQAYRTDVNEETGKMWTNKYPGKGDNAAPDCNNIVVLRLSEMYLNRAEATLHGAQKTPAAHEDLNQITSNRGASAYAAATLTDVEKERRKELAWEGHYVYDLARWGKSVVRTEFTLGSMNQNVEFPSYKWALPIPQREMDANENLVQNEGYSTGK